MGTFLFDKIVFGPIYSRRLGNSLGINLLPLSKKICSFNCIYCECGWTNSNNSSFVDIELFESSLKEKLIFLNNSKQMPDALTFAGNGEPTLHPEFENIIDITIKLRNLYTPNSKIAVLSNSTTLHKDDVFNALKKIDKAILKLDTGTQKMYNLINQCNTNTNLEEIVNNLSRFEGKLTIQTLLLRGKLENQIIDNTSDEEISLLINHLNRINPAELMLYTISRETPINEIEKISYSELDNIKNQINLKLPNINISVFR